MKRGIAQSVAKVIQVKFGEAGKLLQERAYQLEETELLQQLMERLLRAQNLSEVEQAFDEVELPSHQARAS